MSNTTSTTSTASTIHPWEAAGLGKAPFRFVGVDTKRGPIRFVDPKTGVEMQVGSPGQPMGTCDYCSAGIADCYRIRSADGKTFVVGSDCVARVAVKGDPVLAEVDREVAKLRRQRTVSRNAARIESAASALESDAVRSALASMPHPSAYSAKNGRTLLDYVEWMIENAGNAGKVKAARIIEKHGAAK